METRTFTITGSTEDLNALEETLNNVRQERGIDTETRNYSISGSSKNLDTIELILKHIQYLGDVGASRSIAIRIDGDGSGRIKVERNNSECEKDEILYAIGVKNEAITTTYDIN